MREDKPTSPTQASTPVAPEALPSAPTPQPSRVKRARRWPFALVLIAVAVLSGLGGSFLWLKTGLVQLDATETITQNRDKIVLQQGEIVADVAKKVGPSVVSITTASDNGGRGLFGGVKQGAGSGFIVSADGYILTNKHVVPEGTERVKVTTASGQTYDNVVVKGRDPLNDVAFLKIDGVNSLPAVTLADSSKVSVGQQVVAIGNALGQYQNSVTSGIISGLGRPVVAGSESSEDTESLENLFQTDAAINPGNSGGPLLNLNGEVIGINTAIAQDAQGIGFAIPINDTKSMIESMIGSGQISRPMLGVRYISINDAVATSRKLPVKAGALLTSSGGNPAIISGGPGDKAGLRSGDIITKINNDDINPSQSLLSLVGRYKPGDTVTLMVLRDGKTLNLKATLDKAPEG